MENNNGLARFKQMFGIREQYMKTNIVRPARRGRINLPPTMTFTNGNSVGGMSSGVAGAKGGLGQSNNSNDKYLSIYYHRLEELRKYEMSDLVETVVSIYKDYILESVKKVKDPITFLEDDHKKYEKLMNKVFNDLGLIDEVLENVDKIIYGGSYSIGVVMNEQQEIEKQELHNPTEVVSIYEGNELKAHLCHSKDGSILIAKPRNIIRFGNESLSLTNDINEDKFPEIKNSMFRKYKFKASRPLFYGSLDKLKEFLLKDKLISLLSIKDLIQPLLLLIKVENSTGEVKATELARNSEQLINNYVDTASFLAGTFSIDELVQALVNNVKVLPDFNGSLSQMEPLDLTKLTDKLEQLKNNQDGEKEGLLNVVGIPLDLLMNRSSRFEAIKTSERLNSRVDYFVNSIRNSLKEAVVDLVYLYTKVEITPEQITLNCFAKTAVEINKATGATDQLADLVAKWKELLESAEGMAKDSGILDKKVFLELVRSKLIAAEPELADVITLEMIEKYVKEAEKAPAKTNDDY